MASIVLGAAVTCLAALFLGQAALRLAGAKEWSWLAPAVGLSVAMLAATPTTHVPGRTVTVAILFAVLAVAAAVWCLRSPPHRPPLPGLLAALPVVFLVLVPFLAVGRGGILGVTVNNDMTVHLTFVEGFLSPTVAELFPLPKDYPLGPHAVSALLVKGLGIPSDLAFSAFTMALPVIGAWTVLAAARRAPWPGQVVAATVAGMPFLVAAYYGQGSFKEIAQAGLVLAVALSVSGCGPRLGLGRWVPLALLTGGVISAYSPAGLLWVVTIVGLWLAGLVAIQAWRRRRRSARRAAPAGAADVGIPRPSRRDRDRGRRHRQPGGPPAGLGGAGDLGQRRLPAARVGRLHRRPLELAHDRGDPLRRPLGGAPRALAAAGRRGGGDADLEALGRISVALRRRQGAGGRLAPAVARRGPAADRPPTGATAALAVGAVAAARPDPARPGGGRRPAGAPLQPGRADRSRPSAERLPSPDRREADAVPRRGRVHHVVDGRRQRAGDGARPGPAGAAAPREGLGVRRGARPRHGARLDAERLRMDRRSPRCGFQRAARAAPRRAGHGRLPAVAADGTNPRTVDPGGGAMARRGAPM